MDKREELEERLVRQVRIAHEPMPNFGAADVVQWSASRACENLAREIAAILADLDERKADRASKPQTPRDAGEYVGTALDKELSIGINGDGPDWLYTDEMQQGVRLAARLDQAAARKADRDEIERLAQRTAELEKERNADVQAARELEELRRIRKIERSWTREEDAEWCRILQVQCCTGPDATEHTCQAARELAELRTIAARLAGKRGMYLEPEGIDADRAQMRALLHLNPKGTA